MPRIGRYFAAVLLAVVMVSSFPAASAGQEASPGTRKVVTRVSPLYPAMARSMNIRGSVKLEAVVTPNGAVKSVEIKGGHPLLVQAAENAVREWKFEPAVHETRESIEIKFNPE